MRNVRPAVAVSIATAIFYLPGVGGAFLAWDDWTNFTQNPDYQGLSPRHLDWMFRTFHMGHYQPLTWITLGLDYTLWGLQPAGYHVTSLLLHAVSAGLLYAVLRQLIDSTPASAIGALFWALHPLRVESVTWITERRDVLCGVFFLLSVLAYLRMCRNQEAGKRWAPWLLLSTAAYAASLLSKSLGLMLPFALLLLDVVPLRRWTPGKRRRILLEKLPYAACAILVFFVTLAAMKTIGQVRTSAAPLERIAQGAFGACLYLWKTLLPWNLSPLYPINQGVNPAEARFVVCMVAAPLLTAGLGLLAWKKRPAPFLAWAAFLLLAAPVLGAVVRGYQLAADRYTYLAALPFSLLLAAACRGVGSRAALGIAGTVLLALGVLTGMQTRVWRDDLTLWNHAIASGWGGAVAYTNRGAEKYRAGDPAGALADFEEALRQNPKHGLAWLNHGKVFEIGKEYARAIEDYTRATECEMRSPDALERRAAARERIGDAAGATADCDEAIRRFPAFGGPWTQRARLKIRANDVPGALADLDEGLKRSPRDASAYLDRGKCRFALRDVDGAWKYFSAAVAIYPRLPGAHQDRGSVLGLRGKFAEAVNEFSEELRIDPGALDAWRSRGLALLKMGMRAQAAADFEQALRIAPPTWESRREVEGLLSELRKR